MTARAQSVFALRLPQREKSRRAACIAEAINVGDDSRLRNRKLLRQRA